MLDDVEATWVGLGPNFQFDGEFVPIIVALFSLIIFFVALASVLKGSVLAFYRSGMESGSTFASPAS